MSDSVIKKRLVGALLMIFAYLVLQTFIVIAHEYAHSTSAWLLGYMPSPFTVVWGNPITVRGWDEGVWRVIQDDRCASIKMTRDHAASGSCR